mgnify:CR=1 FL=1
MFTIFIIIIVALTSYLAFQNRLMFAKGAFIPYDIARFNQYYRFLSHIFLHVSWEHLIFNMLTLYFFGMLVESGFAFYFGKLGTLLYLMEFLLAGVVATIPSFFKNKNNPSYSAVGASGAVSAILFSSFLLDPINKIYIMFIPICIPAYVFGPAYLLYCVYMAKRNADNVAHDVHFWGALVGFLLPLLFMPELLENFISLILNQ